MRYGGTVSTPAPCCCHEGSDGDDSPLRPRRHTVIPACVLSSQPDHLPRSHSVTLRTSASLTACLQLHRRCLKQPNCCSRTIVDKCSVSSDFRRNPQPTSHITLAHHLPRIYLPSAHTTQTEKESNNHASPPQGVSYKNRLAANIRSCHCRRIKFELEVSARWIGGVVADG